MAGYGGQDIALDVAPNYPNAANPLEQFNQLQQQGATLDATRAQTAETGARTAQIGASTALTNAQLPGVQAASQEAQTQARMNRLATNSAQIARAASLVDPNAPDAADKWNAAMQKLADAGIDNAAQFVGKYTPRLQSTVVNAYGSSNPLEAASAMGSGGVPASVVSPILQAQFDQHFQGMSLPQLQATATNLDKIKQGLLTVGAAQSPAAQWDVVAKQMNRPDLVGHYSPLLWQQLYNSVAPTDDYLQSRITQQSAGVPAPVIPQEVKAVGEQLYAVNPNAPGGPTARQIGGVGTPPPSPGQSGGPATLDQFASRVEAAENNTGNPAAKNPNSNAAGNGQFIPATWLTLMKANRPDLTQGKTSDQILAMRSDPHLAHEMTMDYGMQNASTLASKGQPVNSATLGIAHGLGVDGAIKLLSSIPNTPMSEIVSPLAMKENPQFKNMTVAQYTTMMANRYGTDPVAVQGISEGIQPSTAAGLTTGGLSTAGANVHGSDYLKTISPNMASQVQALADGREQFPSGFALTKPYWQQMMSAVAQYDPSFNQADFNARAKTRASFTSGPNASNITSYNTTIGHLDRLNDSINGLKNTGFPMWNAVSQATQSAAGNQPTQAALAQFNTDKGAASSELVKALRGSGGAEADIQYWQRRFDQADSPAALHSAVREAANLLGSRIDALTDQYNTGMGTSNQTVPGLSPHAAQSLKRLQTTGIAGVPASTPGGQMGAPGQVGVPDGAIRLLRSNPALAAQFDAKYGHGSAAQYLGAR